MLPFEKAFTSARQSSDPEGEEVKNKKFATAIVEYGKVPYLFFNFTRVLIINLQRLESSKEISKG